MARVSGGQAAGAPGVSDIANYLCKMAFKGFVFNLKGVGGPAGGGAGVLGVRWRMDC